MKKSIRILAAAIAATSLIGLGSAAAAAAPTAQPAVAATAQATGEQPAAADYRRILTGKQFVVTYQADDETDARRIVADGSRRFSHSAEKKKDAYVSHYDVYLKDGILYNFFMNKKKTDARVLPLADLGKDYVDPAEKWPDVMRKLALPRELAIFAWQDPLTQHAQSETTPKYQRSYTKTVQNTSYTCDRYIENIMTQAGTVSAQIAYDALYTDGKLQAIQSILIQNGQESPIRTVQLIDISDQVGHAADEPKNCDLYAANDGGIEELTKTPRHIGTMGGTSK